MITHKNPEITGPQLTQVHPHLQEILEAAAFLAYLWYKDDLRITAIYNPDHPGPTHRVNEKYHRFVDCSLLPNGGVGGSGRLRDVMNVGYVYCKNPDGSIDYTRSHYETVPPLNHEPEISTAPHFHFQIPPIWLGV